MPPDEEPGQPVRTAQPVQAVPAAQQDRRPGRTGRTGQAVDITLKERRVPESIKRRVLEVVDRELHQRLRDFPKRGHLLFGSSIAVEPLASAQVG
jgi:hypothetical protein